MKGSSCGRGTEPSGLEAFLWLCPGHPSLSSTVEHQYFDLSSAGFFQCLPAGFSVLLWQLKLIVFSPNPRLVAAFFVFSLQFLRYPAILLFFLSCCKRVTAELRFKLQENILCPAPSASRFCTHDGFHVKQCLQVGCHLQGLDLCTAMNRYPPLPPSSF